VEASLARLQRLQGLLNAALFDAALLGKASSADPLLTHTCKSLFSDPKALLRRMGLDPNPPSPKAPTIDPEPQSPPIREGLGLGVRAQIRKALREVPQPQGRGRSPLKRSFHSSHDNATNEEGGSEEGPSTSSGRNTPRSLGSHAASAVSAGYSHANNAANASNSHANHAGNAGYNDSHAINAVNASNSKVNHAVNVSNSHSSHVSNAVNANKVRNANNSNVSRAINAGNAINANNTNSIHAINAVNAGNSHAVNATYAGSDDLTYSQSVLSRPSLSPSPTLNPPRDPGHSIGTHFRPEYIPSASRDPESESESSAPSSVKWT